MDSDSTSNGSDHGDTVPSEMEIVDTFTRLIFDAGQALSVREEAILHTLCLVDDNAANCRAEDYPKEVGAYLRALGVTEMTRLVRRVRENWLSPVPTGAPVSPGQHALF